jgi:hypothetical protein
MSEIQVVEGYVPGAIGRITELHGVYYHRHWGFGLLFEAKVAEELSEFLKRYEEGRDGLWIVLVDGRVEGSIAIDGLHGPSQGAHLRWFILSDALRGSGLENRKINWIFEGLGAARHLYEKVGFRLVAV